MSDQMRELLDRESIRDLISSYSLYIDTNRPEEWVGLFTDDAVFDAGPQARARGHEELRRIRRRSKIEASSHHNSNVLITFDTPDQASVRTTYHAWHRIGSGAEPSMWGYYDDVVVRTPAGWRFSERTIRVYGEEPGFQMEWNPGERLANGTSGDA